MRKIKGLKLRNCLIRVSKWIQLKARVLPRHYSLRRPQPPSKPKLVAKLLAVCRSLTNGAKALCSNHPNPSYVPVGGDAFAKETVTVPKGHLAVYVGQKDGEFHRILVPVVYFNHPLFGELLMEAEEEYGFQQPGGILTIPCGFTKFQRVQTRIKTGSPAKENSWGPLSPSRWI